MKEELFQKLLLEVHNSNEEDLALDLMDFVTGFCSPHVMLFP